MPTTPHSAELLGTFNAGRPLEHPLDAYWQAPGGSGPLAATWQDKPHRLLYDLIAALIHGTPAIVPSTEADTPDGLPTSALAEIEKLRKEYRPSMAGDIVHSWAGDLVSAIDKLKAAPIPSIDQLDMDRGVAANEAWLRYDFGCQVEDADGWERITPGDEWTRKVYFDADEADAPSIQGSFTVLFEPGTARISEAYALCNGQRIGNPI